MEELPDAIHKVPKTTNLQQLAMYYSMADIVLNLHMLSHLVLQRLKVWRVELPNCL